MTDDDVTYDGFTLDELCDYLDDGREPRNAAIESSEACVEVLVRLNALRNVSWEMLDADAEAGRAEDERWIARVLSSVRSTAHAGRTIPVPDDDPLSALSITEGVVRGVIRRVGDGFPDVVVRRTRLRGDVGTVGAPVEVEVTVSVATGSPVRMLADGLRDALVDALAEHTPLVVADLVVRVVDVHGGAV
jgi:hypothetical protein